MRKTALALAVAAALTSMVVFAATGGPGYGCAGEVPAASTCTGAGPGYGRGGMGPGHGMGGMGPGYGGGAMGPGYGMGGGKGPGYGARGMGYGAGEPLLTPEERLAFRDRMHGAKTIAECKAAFDEHRALLEERAKEKNVTLPGPRFDMCDRMAARGVIK